ncbi:DHHC palmitoyltransferase-domain-containing protein [Lactifluus volemus]|nr:DHHC palmitoyltransferase-domain-containing protein [Lactifluus volemus]
MPRTSLEEERPNGYLNGDYPLRSSRRPLRKSPQPWFVLKFTILVASAIIAYTAYVYIGRFCIPMIKHRHSSNSNDQLGSRTLGIAFLAVFVVLGLMVIWAYIKVVFTPPGYAIDHVQRPMASEGVGRGQIASQDIPMSYPRQSHSARPPAPTFPSQISQGSSTRTIPPSSTSLTSPSSSLPPRTRQLSRGSSPYSYSAHAHSTQSRSAQRVSENGGVHMGPYTTTSPPQPTEKERYQRPTRGRKPSSLPSLREDYRRCDRCGIIKPPRTHHCRACGKCVLKYDHHCPWIGQCVGAQNQKFFFVFVVWSVLLALWTFSTLLALNVRAATREKKDIDPQHIVVIAMAGMFSLFTTAMLSTHIALITTNQTTVEHISTRAMKDREDAVLDDMHSFCAFSAKRRTRKQWDAEWGRIGREGNMWWLDNIGAHWEQVFGPRKWTWLLPIGTTKDLGFEYPRNPRFDAEGRWMPRKQWPPELR